MLTVVRNIKIDFVVRPFVYSYTHTPIHYDSLHAYTQLRVHKDVVKLLLRVAFKMLLRTERKFLKYKQRSAAAVCGRKI